MAATGGDTSGASFLMGKGVGIQFAVWLEDDLSCGDQLEVGTLLRVILRPKGGAWHNGQKFRN